MKKIIFVFLIAVTFALTACSGNKVSDAGEKTDINEAESIEKNIVNTEETTPGTEDNRVIKVECEIDQLYNAEIGVMGEHASDVIIGTMESFDYKSVDGCPWTVLTITVAETLKGELKADEQILLYTYGGRLSLKEYLKSEPGNKRFDNMSEEDKEKTIVEISFGDEIPENGKKYIFFLIPTMDKSPLPSEVYDKVTVGKGTVLELSDDGLSASRVNPDTEETEVFTVEEIKNLVN